MLKVDGFLKLVSINAWINEVHDFILRRELCAISDKELIKAKQVLILKAKEKKL
jgi:hypothetical protein